MGFAAELDFFTPARHLNTPRPRDQRKPVRPCLQSAAGRPAGGAVPSFTDYGAISLRLIYTLVARSAVVGVTGWVLHRHFCFDLS